MRRYLLNSIMLMLVIGLEVMARNSYDYDAQGNWTRRVAQKEVKKNDKSLLVAYVVPRRTISYFQ